MVDLLNDVLECSLNLVIQPYKLLVGDNGISLAPVVIRDVGFDILLKADFLTFKLIDNLIFTLVPS